MRRALIVYGGWDGHDPVRVSKIFRDILEEEGFSVELSDTLESFGDAEGLKGYDLIVPHWTMGEIPDKYARNVADRYAVFSSSSPSTEYKNAFLRYIFSGSHSGGTERGRKQGDSGICPS